MMDNYCPEVLSQRAEYRAVMTELYIGGLRPSLLYPAGLHVILTSGEKKWLHSVDEADKFIAGLPANVTGQLKGISG